MIAAAKGGAVLAQDALKGLETIGKPWADGIALQPAATEIAVRTHRLDWMVLVIITLVTLLVVLLLLWVLVRYNQRANKTAATFTHNSAIEVIWTLGPILILIVIGAFSLPVLFFQMEVPKADVTIKVTGNQWYWSYQYTDDEFGFDSFLLARDELESHGYAPDEYLLATDAPVVVPVNKNVVLQITGADVIHSWTIPAFAVKLDAVPGRLQETWFNADKEGVYFGQCSELCGKDHAYMPITVKVVSEAAYAEWLKAAKAEYAGQPAAVTVASN
ncbi:MAG: cytochrome c oxidase subunit II [Rhodobacteraceae bacterium]|nr:cytochrome c oxidase subunit II [Paracoccaceae bacterium]